MDAHQLGFAGEDEFEVVGGAGVHAGGEFRLGPADDGEGILRLGGHGLLIGIDGIEIIAGLEEFFRVLHFFDEGSGLAAGGDFDEGFEGLEVLAGAGR